MSDWGEQRTNSYTQDLRCRQRLHQNLVRTAHPNCRVACTAAQVRLTAAKIAFREKREALNALLAEAESLLRPFPEEHERLARLVEGPL